MGDGILGLSAIRFLKYLFPEAKIDYAVPEWMAESFVDAKDINQIVSLDFKNVLSWAQTYSKIRRSYDVILELNQSGRSGNFFKLYSQVKRTPYFYHNHNENVGEFVLDQGIRKPNIQKDLDLIYSFVTKILKMRVEYPHYLNYEPKLENTSARIDQIVLGMVATRKTKIWDFFHFVELIKNLRRDYPQFKLIVPLSSSAIDQEIKMKLLNSEILNEIEILEKPLKELVSRIAQSKFYIGNDTGLKHLSVAYGLRTLSFFGPEEPMEWHPYAEEKHPCFFISPLECRTISSHFCGLDTCDVMACLKPILPSHVMQKFSLMVNEL